MFDSTKEDLKDILGWVDKGRLQLPDFQRDYVWGDDDVRSLIASIAKGFPVGALLTLETGGEIEFKPRLLEGVELKDVCPDELLLDGQQRITSLYQAAYAQRPLRARTKRRTIVERFYYLDIKKTLNSVADLEDAILGVPADRVIRTNFGKTVELDLSTRESEFEADLFPLNQVFDSRDWFYDWRDYWKARGRDVSDMERDFDRNILDRIERYKMPIIRLDKKNSREAICLVFEKVNVGGKKLDAFELVTAVYAAEKYDLREDWLGPTKKSQLGRKSRMMGPKDQRDVLKKIASTDFLQACTLLHTREIRLARAQEGIKEKELPQVSCKRDALLGLPLQAYRKHADAVERGFIEAAGLLNEQKIIWHRDVPYQPQIVALAATVAILGQKAQTIAAKKKLVRWFWAVALGELYSSSSESRLARDVPELVDWISGHGDKPRAIDEAFFQVDRLRSLYKRGSAAYKGIHALLMRHGCLDFISGRSVDVMTFFKDEIDIHHIFPQDWCKKQGIPSTVFDSIVNKTPLSKRSNTSIGAKAPSAYLKQIEDKQGLSSDQLDAILRTHLIEPEHLRTDNFQAFFDARIKALSNLVAEAMEKPIVEEHGTNEPEIEIELVGDDADDVENEELA